MEWVVGTITLMAAMAAITGGGMGIRLLYIDMEYRRIIRSKSKKTGVNEQRKHEGSISKSAMRDQPDIVPHKLGVSANDMLLDLCAKKNSNRRGVIFDSFCVIIILADGLVTALGYSSNLTISVMVAFAFFLGALTTLQYHGGSCCGNYPNLSLIVPRLAYSGYA